MGCNSLAAKLWPYTYRTYLQPLHSSINGAPPNNEQLKTTAVDACSLTDEQTTLQPPIAPRRPQEKHGGTRLKYNTEETRNSML